MNATDYELLDCGDGRRLERFGERIVDRPAPAATAPRRAPADTWRSADLRFDRERGWSGPNGASWTVQLDGLTLELRPTPAGGLGVFPEHALWWPWLRDVVAEGEQDLAVLHLFAATGATTLALARAGARVTHVDASRPSVAWARRNAELSGCSDAPIRWIVDDALAFTRREARRGRTYGGIVLDPPSYGHGPGGTRWTLEVALAELLAAAAAVTTKDAFVLVTGHTTGLGADDLADQLADAFAGGAVAADDVILRASTGATLPSGVAARMIRG